jgi:arsenite methyltransferase
MSGRGSRARGEVGPVPSHREHFTHRHAEDAGFAEIDIELRVTVKAGKRPVPWERFTRMTGNPLIPTFGEALGRALSPREAAELTAHLRPLVESGTGQQRRALGYLTAIRG